MGISNKILNTINRTKRFITEDVWIVRLDDFPKHIATLLKYLRVFLVSFRRFNEDKVQLRASALTYYSLLAIVPILAMGFGIAKGFGFDKDLEKRLVDNFMGQEEVLNWIISFAHNMLENTKGGLVAGVGLAILFWSVIKMMGNIENSFNEIWQVKKERSYVRKFSNYLSMMLVVPVFIFLASSGSMFMAAQLDNIASSIQMVNLIPLVTFLMKLFPYVMTWALLTLLYVMIPNTNVKFFPAFISGVFAGTAFLLVQWFYIYAQMGMSRYNVIYGSFAALPLLLFWLRASWLIILLGAELSYARQNVELYEWENESLHISHYAHRACCILLLEVIVRRFIDDKTPLKAHEFAIQMKLPIYLIRTIIVDLHAANLISEVNLGGKNNDENAYAPAKDVKKYTIKYIMESLDKKGNNQILTRTSEEMNKILNIQENFLKVMENMPDNILLADMAEYKYDNQTL